MLEYSTVTDEATPVAELDVIPFKIDGVEYQATRPDEGQLAMMLASISKFSGMEEGVGGFVNFFFSMLDDKATAELSARLYNPLDTGFRLGTIQRIMEDLVKEWSARPTESPSGSAPSPPSTG